MSVVAGLNATVTGVTGGPAIVFAHGYGCDQRMWRLVAPAFEDRFQVVTFDLAGTGDSDLVAYDAGDYSSLGRYARDLLDLCHELHLEEVVLVAHSVSAMIGVLAQIAEPDLIGRLVLVGPSARYVDDGSYVGGFSEADIADLLDLMDSNHLGWQDPLSQLVAGADRGPAQAELESSFCRMRPDVAHRFAELTFLGDNRADLAEVTAPTLVVQSSSDSIAPLAAGQFVRDAIPGGTELVVIDTVGHCPHLTAPAQTIAAIDAFLAA